MTDYLKGEQLYRDFIQFRSNFLKNAVSKAAHTDTTEDGMQIRPIVVVPSKQASKFRAEIDTWRSYVAELEKYPKLNIPKTLMYPIPEMLTGVRKAIPYNTEAVNSSKMNVKRLKHLINKDIRIHSAAGKSSEAYIASLNKTLEELSKYPDDEPMRMRIHGFRETVINLYFVSDHPAYNDGNHVALHVPLCGLFINDEAMRDGLVVDRKFVRSSAWSVYDEIEPIICQRWPTAKIYSIKDIEDIKSSRKKTVAKKIENKPGALYVSKNKAGKGDF